MAGRWTSCIPRTQTLYASPGVLGAKMLAGRSHIAARKIRWSRSVADSCITSGRSFCEPDLAVVDKSVEFHYAPAEEQVPYSADVVPSSALHFPQRCAALALRALGRARALDVGCMVGGMSFELARHFGAVVGVDTSRKFLAVAEDMKVEGLRSYTSIVEGDIVDRCTAEVGQGIDRSRCSFEHGDACDLRPDIGTFDAILAANLLCRLASPVDFLKRCASLLEPGGVLVIVSPYSWSEERTPRDRWLGGHAGVLSFDAMSAILRSDGFDLRDRRDMPFIIRQDARRFIWGCSDGTVWGLQ